MKKKIALAIIVLIILIICFVLKKDSTEIRDYFDITIIEKNVTFGDIVDFIDGNLKVSINEASYDTNNNINIIMDFSSVDGRGISSYIIYDFIIYDADKNILATNVPSGIDDQKRNFASGFAKEHYNEKSFKAFSNHSIGSASIGNNITDEGKVQQYIKINNLMSTPNLETLTIRLTNIRYKNLGEAETITVNNDFMVTYKKMDLSVHFLC